MQIVTDEVVVTTDKDLIWTTQLRDESFGTIGR
jgi:hypothetical protein